MGLQQILYSDDAFHIRCVLGRIPDILSRRDHAAQGDGAVIAIDLDRVALRYPIFGERAFYLNDQEVIVCALCF